MANNMPTTYVKKLQVGARGNFQDKFTFKVAGKDGGFGLPEFTEAERDACWPVLNFPNPDWRGAMIYNLTNERIQYNTGATWFTFDVSAPPTSIAAFYQQYADDATYVANHGAPVNGSVYYNTSLLAVRVFSNGNWYNDLTPEPWANSTAYIVGQIVWTSTNQIFRCISNHTSSAFPATIDSDLVNWAPMGAHVIGALNDVDTTGAVEGDVLVRNALGIYVPEAKGLMRNPIDVPLVAVEPAAPAAGYVRLYAIGKTVYAKYNDNEVVEMLRQYDVVDFLDAGIIAANTIDFNAVTYLTVVASLAADVKAVQIFDTAGINLGWYDGADNLLFVSGPGTNETTPVEIAAGTEIKVRPLLAAAGPFSAAGKYTVNFLG